MFYIVRTMTGKSTANGYSYALHLDSNNPDFQASILAVTKEQFDSVKVGDKIGIAILAPADAKPELEVL